MFTARYERAIIRLHSKWVARGARFNSFRSFSGRCHSVFSMMRAGAKPFWIILLRASLGSPGSAQRCATALPAGILAPFAGAGFATCGNLDMPKLVIVVHYHEIWLKGGNRRFFLSKLHMALKRALEGLPVERILRPGDRMLIEFGEGASAEEAVTRIERVFGVAFYAVARVVPRGGDADLATLGRAAWDEVRGEKFSTFAVRSKRSDKSFPHASTKIDVSVGQYLVDQLRAEGRSARVKLNDPELTCRIEIPPGPSLLVYARKIPGAGGLPPNTAGRMTCLLSRRFDSAVAAPYMMKRGAHLSFVHFLGGGARPGGSSVLFARELVGQ